MIILLNKTDLVAVEQIDFLESYIHTVKQEPEYSFSTRAGTAATNLDVGYNDPKSLHQNARNAGCPSSTQSF